MPTSVLRRVVLALFTLLAILAAPRLFADELPQPDYSLWREDGFPFQPSRDVFALRDLWKTLEAAPDAPPFARAETVQLRAQGPQYRGKLLSFKGRLLRVDRVEISDDETFYDLWVLLPDSKRDPIRVLSKTLPAGLEVDSAPLPSRAGDPNAEYRRETVEGKGVYYRATSYDAGSDLLTTPTLVCADFRVAESAVESTPGAVSGGLLIKIAAILALGALWFAFRGGRFAKGRRREIAGAFLCVLGGSLGSLWGQTEDEATPPRDVFWSVVAGTSAATWEAQLGEDRPRLDAGTDAGGERREAALGVLARGERLLSADALLERGADEVERVEGRVARIESLALDAEEALRVGEEALYRVEIATSSAENAKSGERATLYLTRLPRFAAPDGFFDAPRAKASTSRVGERVAALGIRFGTEDGSRVYLATRLEWLPEEAPLGRAGVDLSAFEETRVYSREAYEREKDPQRRREILETLRWRAEDRRSFYGSLRAYAQGRVKDAREGVDEVALFNRAESSQGRRVRLKGWARRVNMILVDDAEVRATTGIEKYYQLFFFTNESQGWPIVLCAPELPAGLETGSGEGYRREIEIDGFFYKTWAYRSSAPTPGEDATETSDVKKWTRAPVLVGRVVRVAPPEEEDDGGEAPWSASELFVSFAILAVAWVLLRRRARRPSQT